MPDCLDDLAMIATALGDLDRAARLFAAAAAVRAQTGGGHWGMTLAEREHALAAARAGLGEAAFEAAWAAGSHLPLADVVAEAEQSLGRSRPSMSDRQID